MSQVLRMGATLVRINKLLEDVIPVMKSVPTSVLFLSTRWLTSLR